MKFLGMDTSGEYLAVVAKNEEKESVQLIKDCLHAHSVRLMGEIEGALDGAGMTVRDCDFFSVVVGAGSFTGIRIGVSTVKGLCLALTKPALSLTSFDLLAYAERGGKTLCLVNAGHGYYYAAGYEGESCTLAPAYSGEERVKELIREGYEPRSFAPLGLGERVLDPAKGLLRASVARASRAEDAAHLTALYLRRSSAEENL